MHAHFVKEEQEETDKEDKKEERGGGRKKKKPKLTKHFTNWLLGLDHWPCPPAETGAMNPVYHASCFKDIG